MAEPIYWKLDDLPKMLESEDFKELVHAIATEYKVDEDGANSQKRQDRIPDPDDVAVVIRWIMLGPNEAVPASSYGAKHYAEDWSKLIGGKSYVPNGAAVVAQLIVSDKRAKIIRSALGSLNTTWKKPDRLKAYERLKGSIDRVKRGEGLAYVFN